MSVNGVTSSQAAAAYNYTSANAVKDNSTTEKTQASAENTSASGAEESGVVYEPSKEAQAAGQVSVGSVRAGSA